MRVEDEEGAENGIGDRVQGARSEGGDGERNQSNSDESARPR